MQKLKIMNFTRELRVLDAIERLCRFAELVLAW